MYKAEKKLKEPSEDLLENTPEQQNASGGGGAGNLPRTNWNNCYMGTCIVTVPDNMGTPVTLTYTELWNAIKVEHPIMFYMPVYNPIAVTGIPGTLTVHKVELYGCTSGAISLTPYVQRAPQYQAWDSGVIVKDTPVQGQQLIDVGTLNAKPMLSHTFGNGIDAVRIINYDPALISATKADHDILIAYQSTTKAGFTSFTADVSYLRFSFTFRLNVVIGLQTLPLSTELAQSYEAMQTAVESRNEINAKKRKIAHIKELTLPVNDK